jgi:hypothetical protein
MEEYKNIKQTQIDVSMQIQTLLVKGNQNRLTELEKNERTRLVRQYEDLNIELEDKKHSLLNDSYPEYANLRSRREELIPKDKERSHEENSELAELNKRYNELVQELGL